MTDINEKQIRAAMRHETTKAFAVSNIACKKTETDNPFLGDTVSDVIIYGKGKTRTVAIRTRHGGKRLDFQTLGKVPADGEGYAMAAEMIENWLYA